MNVKKEWFEEWFDTEYYHLLYNNRNYEEAAFFIQNLLTYLKPSKRSVMLDLACGKGRHAHQLSENGFEVLGIDLSENSIREALKLRKLTLDFKVHDMREEIPYLKFDYVFNLFTSFGYFDDLKQNEKVIRNIKSSLNRNGVLIIDFLNSTKVLANLVKEEVVDRGLIKFKINRFIENDSIVKEIRFKHSGKAFHFFERVQLLTLDHFNTFFDSAGMQIKKTFGNYTLDRYNAEKSDRLILIVK